MNQGLFLLFFFSLSPIKGYGQGKKTKCFSIPTFPKKVNDVIKFCQAEVKTNLIEDLLYAAYHENPFDQSKHHHVLNDFQDHLFHHHHDETHQHDPHFVHQQEAYPVNYHHPIHHSPHVNHHPEIHYDHSTHGHQFYHHQEVPIKIHNPHADSTVFHHQHGSIHEPIHGQIHGPIHGPAHGSVHGPAHEPVHGPIHGPISIELHPKSSPRHPVLSPSHHLHNNQYTTLNPQITKAIIPSDPHENHHQIHSVLQKFRINADEHHHDEMSDLKWHRRITKRSLFGQWTKPEEPVNHFPSVISHEDRFLAGCLLQCVYRKNDAVDKYGYPTLDGLTDLYTAGTSEQGFFIHVLRSVDKCLKGASAKHHIIKGKVPIKGETCDVAFDVFDCVSDSITEYCRRL